MTNSNHPVPFTYEAFRNHCMDLWAVQTQMTREQASEIFYLTDLPTIVERIAVQLFLDNAQDSMVHAYLTRLKEHGFVVFRKGST